MTQESKIPGTEELKCTYFLEDIQVQPEDITTLYEALCKCDPELLLEAMMFKWYPFQSKPVPLGNTVKIHLLKKLKATLSLMSSLDPKLDAYIEQIIVPYQSFYKGIEIDSIKRCVFTRILDIEAYLSLRAEIIDRDYVHDSPKSYAEIFSRLSRDFQSHVELSKKISDANVFLPGYTTLSNDPWPQSLGRQIWISSSLCEYERYSVLADVFWAMTAKGLFGDLKTFLQMCTYSNRNSHSASDEECKVKDFYDAYESRMNRFVDAMNRGSLYEMADAAALLVKACS